MMGEKIKENKESEIITEDQLQAVCRQYLQVQIKFSAVMLSIIAGSFIMKCKRLVLQL